jgi:aspartate carbamoyltransferase regulatory subunit
MMVQQVMDKIYITVGKNIEKFLASLECSNCKENSKIDWLLEKFSEEQPQFICLHCKQTFKIEGLKFKSPVTADRQA